MQTLRSVVAFQSNFDLFKVVSFQIVFLVLQCVILRFNVGFHDINQGINQTQELWPKRKKKKKELFKVLIWTPELFSVFYKIN